MVFSLVLSFNKSLLSEKHTPPPQLNFVLFKNRKTIFLEYVYINNLKQNTYICIVRIQKIQYLRFYFFKVHCKTPPPSPAYCDLYWQSNLMWRELTQLELQRSNYLYKHYNLPALSSYEGVQHTKL